MTSAVRKHHNVQLNLSEYNNTKIAVDPVQYMKFIEFFRGVYVGHQKKVEILRLFEFIDGILLYNCKFGQNIAIF